MKRIIVWIDSKDEAVEQVREKLKDYLSAQGLQYKILESSELIETETD
jgi:hypothetical protein